LGRDGKLLLAAGSSIASNQLEDHIDIVIRYGETIASIQANWITPVKIRRLSLTGTKGFLEADYINQSISIFESVPELIKGVPWDFFAVSTESEPTRIDVDPREPLRSELEHFLACIRTGAPPLSDALSATRALALAIDATNATRGVGVGLSV
jgi:UDP-N-acetylglucosamine 3-dehydrogenase